MVCRPKTGEEALEEPPLSLEVSDYIQQQLDALDPALLERLQSALQRPDLNPSTRAKI